MEKYLLFAGFEYYPSGGWGDYQGSFATLEEAVQKSLSQEWDWVEIVDIDTKQVVY